MPNQVGGDLFHTMDVYRLSRVRTELQSLWVIESLTPHPVEADGQFACHRNLNDATVATHGQMNEATSPVGVPADTSLGLPPPVESATENFLVW
jgi:hypothetical protein